LMVYAAAAGMRPPVLRAVAMALLLLSAFLCRREPDGLSALALAALAYLLWRPYAVFEASFQLSFVIVGGLILWWRPVESHPNSSLLDAVGRKFQLLGRTSVHAFVWSAPLVAYHFGTLSLVAILANLLVVPVVPAIILPALLCFMLSFGSISLAQWGMSFVVEPVCYWLLGITRLLASIPLASVEVPAFSGWWLALYYGLLLATWQKYVRKP
ncbi:MAG TPA: ComEC/Rec2 family competence protein, partial [Fimbriimonadaceae bacterium]|nr:ComEC/Rec2 family competence protein [Fimbriimonadaceae bacterium]